MKVGKLTTIADRRGRINEPTGTYKVEVILEGVFFEGFMERRHKLNLRHPQLASLTRISGYNEVVAHAIFNVLEITASVV
jgi:hypothetical protein